MAWSTIFRIAALIGFALTGASGATLAADNLQPASVRAHLEIAAATDCATVDSIAARVVERSKRIVFVDSAADVTVLRGKISRSKGTGGGVFADLTGNLTGGLSVVLTVVLTVLHPSGRQSSRHLTAPTCEEAAEALALLVAMTLDPAAVPRAVPQPQADASKVETSSAAVGGAASGASAARAPSPPGSAPVQAGTGPTRASDTAAPAVAGARAPTQESAASIEALAPTPQPSARWGGFGLFGAGMTGPAPRAMLGLGAYGFFAFDRASPLSLALRVTAAHHGRNGIRENAGTADFALDVAGLDICGLRLRAGPLTARACASGRIGRLSAAGSDTYDAQSHGRFFASTGGTALVTAELPAAFEFTAEAGLGFALTRHEFAFNPQVFYRTQPVTFTLGMGIGRRFW